MNSVPGTDQEKFAVQIYAWSVPDTLALVVPAISFLNYPRHFTLPIATCRCAKIKEGAHSITSNALLLVYLVRNDSDNVKFVLNEFNTYHGKRV